MLVYYNPKTMKNSSKLINISLASLFSLTLIAQEKQVDDDLGTQEVTVVKSYRPSLKDVFKIRTTPKVDDSLIQKKQQVNYTFQSVPVVSTFVPNKATPLKLQRQQANRFHNSYLSGGFGSKSQMLLNFTSTVPLDRTQSVGLDLRYTSLDEIPETILESSQKRLTLNMLHQYKLRNMRVDSDLRFDRQSHNFFGLRGANWDNIPSFRSTIIDPKQNLNYLSIQSKWQWYESAFRKVNFNTHITTDSFDSTEHIIKINTLLRIPLFGQYLELTPNFELINSSFVSGYYSDQPLDFKKGLAQLQLQFLNIGEKLNFRIGANGFYPTADESKIYVYPKVEFSYKTNSGKMVPFIDYQGAYKLNSFTSFSLENPYVAPSLDIQSTQVNHEGNVGFKAYPGSGLSFKLVAHYSEYDNYAMFMGLPYDNFNNDVAYRLGNSFGVVYDSLEKIGLTTGISMHFSEFNKLSLDASYFDYKRANNDPVWNIPALTINFEGNFKLGKKIFFQFSGNYMSKRDIVNHITTINPLNINSPYTLDSLGAVFGISSSITWKINSEWDLFYENKMFFGDVTSRWAYYQNQKQLHLGGIRYKFDINL